MFRTRPTLLLALTLIAATFVSTGCMKKKLSPEVRVPGDGSASVASTDSGAHGTSSRSAGQGTPWSPDNAPDAVGGGTGIRSDFADGPLADFDASSGGFAQTANLDGVDSAMQVADLDMVHFGFDEYQLDAEWRQILEQHAKWLRSNPGVHVQIEGHTDERGTEEYNVTLGQRRADTVREFLIQQGIEDYRLSTISYGKLRPLTFEDNEEAHFLNRRAMFLVYSPGTETASAW